MRKLDVKILLDTNILIQTEDNKQIDKVFAELLQKCHLHGIEVYIHEASIEDINRDLDVDRRGITLSKVSKYPLLTGMPCPSKIELEGIYGPIKKDNDYVDVRLLHALKTKSVGLLVSEDLKLHGRAEKVGLSDRILHVSEALGWIKQMYEPKHISLPYVSQMGCHQVDINQDIFTSLKADYVFEKWFNDTCIPSHRPCWTVNENGKIIAIAIWKNETGKDFLGEFESPPETIFINNNDKVLKICTYKVHDGDRGSKIGEHLLKQILWHSHTNAYDWIYVTAYLEKQSYLASFLQGFGFTIVGKKGEEVIFVKAASRAADSLMGLTPINFHRQYYPTYYDGPEVKKFIIPVQAKFHLKLFPEYSPDFHPTLFSHTDLLKIKDQIPGNTIKKVYLGRPKAKEIPAGSLAFFYMSKDDNFLFSQSLTIVGVINGVTSCNNFQELTQATAKRSVYSQIELEGMFKGNASPVKAIDFLIAGHLEGENKIPIKLDELIDEKILSFQPISMVEIPGNQYEKLKKKLKIVH